MKNLKRVLSLGLASVMLLGMMVMGTSAASFSDAEDIKNTEAVNLMVALNIIKGKDTGAFDPKGNVTRGEMAKMITMILFGGEEATLTTSATPKFTDVTNHWARKYIEYCAGEKQGIIAGMGDGTFAPDAPVTGTAAAKMALVALGYNAKVYGFENNRDWDLNINTVANSKDANLYKGLKALDPSQPITRDQAAQILFNALNAKIVEPTYTVTSNGVETLYTVSKTTTMLMDRFEVTVYVATLDKAVWDKDDEEYDYTFSNVKVKDTNEAGTISKPSFSEDMSSLFMQKVEVVTDDEGNILGIGASEDNNILASGIVGDLTVEKKNDAATGKLKVGKTVIDVAGTGTDRAGNLEIYNVNTATETTVSAKANLKDYWSVKVLDKDGDNKADVIVTYPVYVEKVSSVSKTGISANGTYKFEDHTVEEGLKKGDYVVITKAVNTAGKAIVEKAEITNGKIRAEKAATDSSPKQVQVGSTWYKLDGSVLSTDSRGSTYDMVIVNGYVVKADKAANNTVADITDTVLVVAADPVGEEDTIGAGTQKVQLMFTDGTKKIVTVVKMNQTAGEDLEDVSESNKAEVNDLLTYSVNKDGDYELSQIVVEDNFDANKSGTGSFSKGKVTVDGVSFRFADDAVLFVSAKNGKTIKVVTGADVNDWADIAFDTDTNLFSNKENGFQYTALGLIDLGANDIPGLAGDTKYGVVVSSAINATDEDGKKTVELTVWTGSEAEELFTRQTGLSLANFKAGTVVSFKAGSDNEISELKAITEGTTDKDNYAKGAVKAYAGGEEIEIWGDEAVTKLDKDVIILGVNKDGKDYEGIEGAEIRLADQKVNDDGALVEDTWCDNVKYIFTTTSGKRTIDVIIVETNNDFGTTTVVSGSAPVEPETPAAHTHALTWDESHKDAVPATCTTAGTKAYWTATCTGGDGCTWDATKKYDAKGSATEATGNVLDNVTIAATGHTEKVAEQSDVDAGKADSVGQKICTVCGAKGI